MADTICVSSGVITKPLAIFHCIDSAGPKSQDNGPPVASVYPTYTLTSGYHTATSFGNTIIENTADKAIKLSGRVVENEDNSAIQPAHFDGRIEKLYVKYIGKKVTKGQAVAQIYSAE